MVTPESASQEDLVSRVVGLYERSPIVRMLVAAHPPLAIAEAGLLATYNWWKTRRLYAFADDIISLNLNPTEEQVRSREFSEAFGAAAERVLQTKREEKIRLFARLFASYVESKDSSAEGFDTFEEELDILDEVGYREFQLLVVLWGHESRFPVDPHENELERTGHYWKDFQAEVTKKLGVGTGELNAMLQRLTRTGLYQIIVGNYTDYVGNRGYLTPLFERLLRNLRMKESKGDTGSAPP
jgi:hypothetical protein